MAVLTANTVVVDPKTGLPVSLTKGDTVPAWAKKIIGPHLTAE